MPVRKLFYNCLLVAIDGPRWLKTRDVAFIEKLPTVDEPVVVHLPMELLLFHVAGGRWNVSSFGSRRRALQL